MSEGQEHIDFQHSLATMVLCFPFSCVICRQGGLKEPVLRVGSSNCKDPAFWLSQEVGGSVLKFKGDTHGWLPCTTTTTVFDTIGCFA